MKRKSTYTVAEAQSQLPRVLRLAQEGNAIAIRRREETVAYLLSREQLEAVVETLEILSSPDAVNALNQHRAGKTKFFPLASIDE